jgi:hypothetical protein
MAGSLHSCVYSILFPYPKNFVPEGPSSNTLEAIASPSMRGGGWINLSFLRYLQVILMGIGALRGGIITLTPECLQPLMAPPLASTIKLTKNLNRNQLNIKKCSIQISNRFQPKEYKRMKTIQGGEIQVE